MPCLSQLVAAWLLSCAVSALPTGPAPQEQQQPQRNWFPFSQASAALDWLDQSANQLGKGVNQGVNAAASATDKLPSALLPIPDSVRTNKPNPQSQPRPSTSSTTGTKDDNYHYGITYTPYTASGTCKTSSLIHADIAQLKSYGLIRLYGTDCNQTAEVLSALASPRPKNPASTQPETKIIAALPDLKNQQQNLNLIITATTTNPTGWTRIHSIAVGNELLNSAQATAPEIVSAVQTARTTLRAAGYDGPVVAVDTVPSHLQHPEICQVSDYCAVNCHAFFDDKVTPQEAGRYVRTQVDALREVHDAKKVVVTESGWPHAGMGNGVAVPSAENQRVAVRALREEFRFGGEGEEGDVGLVLFSSFDDLWKVDNAYTFGAEKFWGILGH